MPGLGLWPKGHASDPVSYATSPAKSLLQLLILKLAAALTLEGVMNFMLLVPEKPLNAACVLFFRTGNQMLPIFQ